MGFRKSLKEAIKSNAARREVLKNGLFWCRQFGPIVEKGDLSDTDKKVYESARDYLKNYQMRLRANNATFIVLVSWLMVSASILLAYAVGTRTYDYSLAQSVQGDLKKLGAEMVVIQKGFDGRYNGRVLADKTKKLALNGSPDVECSGIRYIAFIESGEDKATVRYKPEANTDVEKKQIERCADLLMRSFFALH